MWPFLGSSCLGSFLLPGFVCLFSFTRLGKFSVIIFFFSNRFLIPCSLIFFLLPLQCRYCYSSCCPKNSLNYRSFFKLFFLFAAVIGQKPCLQIPGLNICIIQLTVYSFLCIPYFRSRILPFWLVLFMVPMLFFILLSILITITLTLYLINCLPPFSSPEDFSCFFIWGMFLYFPILAASLCLFVYIR